MDGYVKTAKLDKNFCFLAAADGQDYYAHRGDFSPQLTWDETLNQRRVFFDITDGGRGVRAVNVRPL